jgi:hypothetical protein
MMEYKILRKYELQNKLLKSSYNEINKIREDKKEQKRINQEIKNLDIEKIKCQLEVIEA